MTPGRALALIALVVSCLAAGAPAQPAPAGNARLRSGAFDPPREAPDFTLSAAGAAEFRLSRYLARWSC